MPGNPIHLTIPRVPKSPNQFRGRHWTIKHADRNDWVKQIWAARMALPLNQRGTTGLFTPDTKPLKMRVKIDFYSPYREMDPSDNLPFAQKPILDAMKGLLLIYDDSSEWCESTITQHKSSKKDMRTEILIETAGAG